MDEKIDLLFVSTVLGYAVEDLIYRQLEVKKERGDITTEGLEWLKKASSPTDKNGDRGERCINYDSINQDITILISLKEQIDTALGINQQEN